MNYEEKYKEALKAVKELREANPSDDGIQNWVNEKFPELRENEDERVRKWLYGYFRSLFATWIHPDITCEEILAWLEKQGECDIDCHQNHQDSSRPNGGIILEDFNGGEGFYKLSLDYLNKKQVEEVEELVRMWNKESKTSNEDIKNCIGMYLTDKVDPKFHEGDWLCENESNNYARFIQILEIVNVQGKERYRISRDIRNIEDIVEFDFLEKYYHKFDIEDVKDGDVLASNRSIFIFSQEYIAGKPEAHCGIMNGFFIMKPESCWTNEEYYPATKKQRDTLFAKIREAGYEWDAKKKELKKIEQKPMLSDFFNAEYERGKADDLKCVGYSEEDEKIINKLIAVVELYYGIGDDSEKQICLSWLKSPKQRMGWKPTKKQMDALLFVVQHYTPNVTERLAWDSLKTLEIMYNDLKKL